MLGRLSQEERQQWDLWIDLAGAVDPVRADDNPGPVRAALLLEFRRVLRHPRGWWRALTRTPTSPGEHRSEEGKESLGERDGVTLDVRLHR